jgi:hypothetical protein
MIYNKLLIRQFKTLAIADQNLHPCQSDTDIRGKLEGLKSSRRQHEDIKAENEAGEMEKKAGRAQCDVSELRGSFYIWSEGFKRGNGIKIGSKTFLGTNLSVWSGNIKCLFISLPNICFPFGFIISMVPNMKAN